VSNFKYLAIFTVSAAAIGLAANTAIAAVSNLSDTVPIESLHSVQVAEKSDRSLSNSKGTLKEGSAISIDPDDVAGIPKAEASSRFILNKILVAGNW